MSAVVLSHQLLYRGLFGVRPADGHVPPPDDLAPLLVSAIVVMVAVALAGRLLPSRWVAVGGAAVAGVAAQVYFVATDWLRAGWGGVVGHDMWFGDQEYWALVGFQVTLISTAFAVAVGTTWGAWRHARTHRQAG